MELPPDDMQKLLVHNTVSIINIKIARWLNEVRLSRLELNMSECFFDNTEEKVYIFSHTSGI